MLVETLWKKWTGGLGQIALWKELDKKQKLFSENVLIYWFMIQQYILLQ